MRSAFSPSARLTIVVTALLVLIGSIRIASTYQVFNHTMDEPHHLAAGMEWLTIHKYRYEDQHPPLARVMGALVPYLAGERWNPQPDAYMEGYRILGHGAHYDRTLMLGRFGILPFFWIASAAVALWAWREAGAMAAMAAVYLFTTLPPVLAHSGLITTDMAVTAFMGVAVLASFRWIESPTRKRTVGFAVAFALAILSKFSSLLFLPAGWAAMYAAALAMKRTPVLQLWEQIRLRRRELVIGAAVLSLVIWAAYWFSFASVPFLHVKLPAPRFFLGLHAVWEHNEHGHPSYLLGKTSPSGFRYYYPVVLLIKTPAALLILWLATTFLAVMNEKYRTAVLPLAFAFGILGAASISHINIGVRHVLPLYLGVCVAAGIGAAKLIETHHRGFRYGALLVAFLLAWQAASGARQHPDYLAYTNELAGDHPEHWVADSDLDWGQDMKRLGARLQDAGAETVTFEVFNRTYLWAGDWFPRTRPGNTEHPSPGWNAVSMTEWKSFGYPKWADRLEPQERIGRSILLWYFPPGTDESRQATATR